MHPTLAHRPAANNLTYVPDVFTPSDCSWNQENQILKGNWANLAR